ncbi:MAG: hypothetical protein K0R28_5897, partial [Paenibacillus sp.]|nr:hypothetical protein [Paenibacillus sp.]
MGEYTFARSANAGWESSIIVRFKQLTVRGETIMMKEVI